LQYRKILILDISPFPLVNNIFQKYKSVKYKHHGATNVHFILVQFLQRIVHKSPQLLWKIWA